MQMILPSLISMNKKLFVIYQFEIYGFFWILLWALTKFEEITKKKQNWIQWKNDGIEQADVIDPNQPKLT